MHIAVEQPGTTARSRLSRATLLLYVIAACGWQRTARAEPGNATDTAEALPAQPSSELDQLLPRAVVHLSSLARQRYDRAMLDDDAEELERAYDALRIALALAPEPELILNLAQVKRHLGDCPEARDLYGKFLASKPPAARAAVAERHLQALGNCEDWSGPLALTSRAAPAHDVLRATDPIGWRSLPAAALAPGEPRRAALEVLDVVPWALAAGSLVSGVLAGVFWLEAGASQRRLRSSTEPQAAFSAAERGKSAQAAARLSGVLAGAFGLGAGVSFWLSWDARREAPAGARSADDSGAAIVWARASGSF
jgi:tetratricopeptide (TPR) repeat protein